MATGAPLSLRYHSDQLNNKVVSLLREFYLTGEFCDIVLHVGSIQIHAHRIVLAAFSPYFRDLFHQPSSKDCSEITLRSHLKEEAVRQLVDFCYSSDITVDTQSAEKILTAANFLQIKEVEKLCITFLAAQQALKSEHQGAQHHVSPITVITSRPSQSPTGDRQKGDHSRELACADTSGIGSNNTSPRHSSRPNSVPSGNGSVIVQPLEDQDLDVVDVKKERDEHVSEPQFFSPRTSVAWGRPDYENLRSMMGGFPGFFFPPVTGALSMPSTSSQHQLLLTALTQNTAGPLSERRELGQIYSSSSQGGESGENKEGTLTEDEGGRISLDLTQSPYQCHICLKTFPNLSGLKLHVMEHSEMLSVPSSSPYKMMSPVRKLSTQSSTHSTHSPMSPKDTLEDFSSGNNMCETCGKSFKDPQSLKFHRYNHVLRYKCNYCGKRFSRSWNLHRHRKTHYRQLQDGAFVEDPSVIDVDADRDNKADIAAYNIEKDKVMTSPYIDYRNHRHDMMPFAFDMGNFNHRRSTSTGDEPRAEKLDINMKDEKAEELSGKEGNDDRKSNQASESMQEEDNCD